MKRAPFLGAAAAVFLNGPGPHGFMRTLAGLGSSSFYRAPQQARGKLRLVPAVPDPVPARVLANPILGEAWRYAGATAPRGWMFARGELLPIATNRDLFTMFRNGFGGDGRTTFALPDLPEGTIVAVTGLFPTSPRVLARTGRDLSELASLGPGAMPGRARRVAPLPAAVSAARKLAAERPRFMTVAPAPLPQLLVDRIAAAKADARSAALAVLGSAARAHLDAAIAGAVAGRTGVYGVVQRMAAELSSDEARRLLAIGDAFALKFNRRAAPPAHANPALEAAHFLASVAIVREQARAIARREIGR
jgi:microcystin-dependent protein